MKCKWTLAVVMTLVACGASSSDEGDRSTTPSPSSSPTRTAGDSGSNEGDATTSPVDDGGTLSQPCPSGLGDRWTCDSSRRIRCVENRLMAEACENGCSVGDANEAVCSCGTHTSFSRWNCASDGNRVSCAGGIAWSVDSCGVGGCSAGPDGSSDVCGKSGALQNAVTKIGASCSAGLRCAMAIRDLVTNARAGYQDSALFVSASSAKALWVGAALHDRTIADVEPHVKPIFEDSDNLESGAVIDLLASPDRVNTFQWQDGKLADVGFCKWNYGKNRVATNCPSVMNGENFFSASDAVSYLAQVWDHSLLGTDKSKALLSWMTLSPRQGYGGWLGTQLPSAARASMHHKAGWRPPGSVPSYSNSNANEIGIVEVPGGHAYAVAILIDGAQSQGTYDNKVLPLLEYLSCVAYHAVAGDSASSCSAP